MTDLPRGTVTFLFTDIEGSTALWERNRKVMVVVVDRHGLRLRQAIETQRRVLIETVGDDNLADDHPRSAERHAVTSAQRSRRDNHGVHARTGG